MVDNDIFKKNKQQIKFSASLTFKDIHVNALEDRVKHLKYNYVLSGTASNLHFSTYLFLFLFGCKDV